MEAGQGAAAQFGCQQRGRHAAAAALLLCCCLTALASPAAAQQNETVGASAATAAEAQFPLIVVFNDVRTLAKLRLMCSPSYFLFRVAARRMGLPLDCHLPGQCKRIYTTALAGMSGDFTNSQLARLERCLPGSIFYKELDGEVHKAEDDSYWLRPEAEAIEVHKAEDDAYWRRPGQGPQGQQPPLQQPQQGGAQQQLGGSGMHRRSRRMQQLGGEPPLGAPPCGEPRVMAFEESVKTPTEENTAVNLWDLTHGVSMNQQGEKHQSLTSRLWNLDRIDQRNLPLDGTYMYGSTLSNGTGEGTTVYVVDSGILIDHQEFKNDLGTRVRASYGRDFVEDDDIAADCDGHGTHVSATAVGLQVGVAKEANVVAVRILDCTGSGTISDTVAGLDWVAANHKKPAVATLSLGIQVGSWSRVLEDAVRNLAINHGITVVVASGNSGVDACYVAPANVPEVITVAASNVATKYNGTKAGDVEDMYKWANTGPCVDLFAPGVDIYSACGGASRCQQVNNMSYTFTSGTSMAVPHVAGVAAIYLSANPTATPQQVSSVITSTATPGKISSARFKAGTPNRLLYSKLDQETVKAANGP